MTVLSNMAKPLFQGEDFAVIVEPEDAVGDPVAWCAANGQAIEQMATAHAVVLIRGTGVGNAAEFQAICDLLVGTPSRYVYRSTPRTEVLPGVMTATEYPPSEQILLHCENAYQRNWPLRLAFCCLQPALSGGQTPLADMRAVTSAIGVKTLDAVERRGIRYIRNYHPGFDLDWRTVFQTDDPEGVEAFCEQTDIEFAWLPDGRLKTSQVCQAVARHPATGDRLWFNQAHLFHPSALGEDMRQDILDIFGEEGLPRDARYGDGEQIEGALLAQVRQAYSDASRMFDWQAGDIMLVDNMLAAHGRRPFTGPRQVLVGMGCMMSERMAND